MKRKICYVLFILLILLNVYDTYSTNVLLNSGAGFYEANPILRFFMSKMGVLPALVIWKGLIFLWVFSFLLRKGTERAWNILTVGLIAATIEYSVGMYFLNYKAMLLLGGVS